MNRRSLRDLLDLEGVDRDAYRLDGTSREEALSLGPTRGGWRVWFTERGRQTTAVEAETEDEACCFLADRLLSDDSNRWVLIAGPASAADADRELAAWLARHGVTREELSRAALRTEDLPWTATESKRRHWILRTESRRLPETLLSDDLTREINSMWEFRMGVHRVGIRLSDGREFPDAFVAGKRVSWVAGCDTIPFRADEVVAVWDQTET